MRPCSRAPRLRSRPMRVIAASTWNSAARCRDTNSAAACSAPTRDVQADGALLGSGRRHIDTRLGIDHVAGDTRCDLTWRGLAADRSRAVLHGGILIRAGADGSNAALSSRNLLLQRKRGDRRAARARNPRRRSAGRARRDGRRARSERAVLPALARPAANPMRVACSPPRSAATCCPGSTKRCGRSRKPRSIAPCAALERAA